LELDSGLELDALRVLQLLLLGAAGLIMMMTDWQAYDYEIDIAAELQRVASEGVAIVAGAECLQVQLAHTSNTLAFMPTVHWPGDGLELRAALALHEVDELLLRQQTAQEAPALPPAAVEQLKLLQRHAQDVVVLVHCRYINQNILQCKSIPTELLLCLEATYGTGLNHDASLWSRLGNSKYHIFTHGLRFGDRKHRRRGSGQRRAAAAAADAAAEDFDESLHIEKLELVSQPVFLAGQGMPDEELVGSSRYEPIASLGAEHTDGSWCTMPPSDTLREASGIESQRSVTISESFLKYIGDVLTGDTTEPVSVDHRSCVSFGSGMSTSTLQSDSEATNGETGGWRLLRLLGPVFSV
jgi:hypothetical protein